MADPRSCWRNETGDLAQLARRIQAMKRLRTSQELMPSLALRVRLRLGGFQPREMQR